MRESCMLGSDRGAGGSARPYRTRPSRSSRNAFLNHRQPRVRAGLSARLPAPWLQATIALKTAAAENDRINAARYRVVTDAILAKSMPHGKYYYLESTDRPYRKRAVRHCKRRLGYQPLSCLECLAQKAPRTESREAERTRRDSTAERRFRRDGACTRIARPCGTVTEHPPRKEA